MVEERKGVEGAKDTTPWSLSFITSPSWAGGRTHTGIPEIGRKDVWQLAGEPSDTQLSVSVTSVKLYVTSEREGPGHPSDWQVYIFLDLKHKLPSWELAHPPLGWFQGFVFNQLYSISYSDIVFFSISFFLNSLGGGNSLYFFFLEYHFITSLLQVFFFLLWNLHWIYNMKKPPKPPKYLCFFFYSINTCENLAIHCLPPFTVK